MKMKLVLNAGYKDITPQIHASHILNALLAKNVSIGTKFVMVLRIARTERFDRAIVGFVLFKFDFFGFVLNDSSIERLFQLRHLGICLSIMCRFNRRRRGQKFTSDVLCTYFGAYSLIKSQRLK